MKKIPEGYKETELGVIPQEWKVSKLGEETLLIDGDRGKNYPSPNEIVDEGVLFLSTSNIVNNKFNTAVTKFITEEKFEKLGKGKAEQGDLIITLRGTLGSVMLFESKVYNKAFINAQMMIIRAKDFINNAYLYQFMISNLFKTQIDKNSSGSAQPQLTKKDVNALLINCPPLPEQQKIAEILSSVDDHIEKLDETISEYELLKKGMMKKLLTEGIGHTEFKDTEIGRIPKDWEVKKVKEICNISTGKKNTQDKKDEGIYPFFVRSDKIEKINSFSYDGEAVLTAGDGVGTGKVFHYINGKFDVHQRVYKMTEFREIQGYFFYLYFSQNFYDRVKRMSAKTSVDSVRMDMISEMDIAVPHENEQKEISQIIYLMTERIDLYKSEKDDFVQVKKGLMEKLLTGKIRV